MKSSLLCSTLLMASFLACTKAENANHSTNSSVNSTSITTPSVTTEAAKTELFTPTPTKTEPQNNTSSKAHGNTECIILGFLDMKKYGLYVIGCLALGCVILLFTTMTLACRVCHLKRKPREYQLCPTDSGVANGKRANGAKPDEAAIMMTEVANEDKTDTETAKDMAEDGQTEEEKEKKKNEDGEKTGATECDKTAETSSSDTNKTAGNEAKLPEGDAVEASKDEEGSDGTNMADETKASTEGPEATEGTGSKA